MPRPVKWRSVCCLPKNNKFGPLNSFNEDNSVTMTVDEYEAVRLIDLEGFTQEECAKQMNVARTTVQGIYIEARRKLAESLVNGKVLFIAGGEYKLCDGLNGGCGRGCCKRKMVTCHGTAGKNSDDSSCVKAGETGNVSSDLADNKVISGNGGIK